MLTLVAIDGSFLVPDTYATIDAAIYRARRLAADLAIVECSPPREIRGIVRADGVYCLAKICPTCKGTKRQTIDATRSCDCTRCKSFGRVACEP